jgi:hypothetical protein
MHHADVGSHTFQRQLDAGQQALAAAKAPRQRAFSAVLEHEQVGFEPLPPVPPGPGAPRDQVWAAVEAVAHQHDPCTCGQQSARDLQRRVSLRKADGAFGFLDAPGNGQRAPANPHGDDGSLLGVAGLHLVDDQNEALAVALLTATMLEVRSANLMDLAASVPRTSERIDMRGLSESHAESRGQSKIDEEL